MCVLQFHKGNKMDFNIQDLHLTLNHNQAVYAKNIESYSIKLVATTPLFERDKDFVPLNSSEATKTGEEILKDFKKVKRQDRESFLIDLIKSKKLEEKYLCEDINDKRCNNKWSSIAGSKELYKAWQDAFVKSRFSKYDDSILRQVSASNAARLCELKTNSVTTAAKNREFMDNPFGDSLDSTIELSEFIISNLLFVLQKKEYFIYDSVEELGFKTNAKELIERNKYNIDMVLFYMDFLDNIKKLDSKNIKTNAKNVCDSG